MEQVAQLAQSLLGPSGSPWSRALGVLGIAVAAWFAARLARSALTRLLQSRGVDEALHNPGFSASMGSIAAALVWLVALPALLEPLGLAGLLAPVNTMMSRLLGFVPSLMGAAVVFAVGWLVARIVRQIVEGLLLAAGSERLAERLGLSAALGERTLAGLVGMTLFALILLPTLAAGLQTLGLDVVAMPVSRLVEQVMALLPRLLSAALIVGLTVVLGRMLADLVAALVAGLGCNRLPAALGLGDRVRPGGRDVSEWIALVVMVAVVFVGLTQAAEVLGLPVLTATVGTLGLVLARLAAGVLVLAVGAWLAALAARAVAASDWPQAPRAAGLARAAVLFFAAALALHQAGLPAEIVSIAFAAVVGSLALGVAVGLAIAIGLGGRPWAAGWLERLQTRPSPPDTKTPADPSQ